PPMPTLPLPANDATPDPRMGDPDGARSPRPLGSRPHRPPIQGRRWWWRPPRSPAFALGDSHISKCPVKSMGCRHGPKHILTAPLVRWVEGVQAETCIFPMLANSCSGPDITCAHTLAPSQGHGWRIERDYLELKQEVGLDHYEGRGWRGFHHHASLCIAALRIPDLRDGGPRTCSGDSPL